MIATLAALALALAPQAATRPPNIVLIVADDLGWGELGCYGQERIRTPRIDQLAREGLRFTQFYAGAPVCAPSRCTLMTGLHTGHAYVRDNREVQPEGQAPIPDATVTLAELLRDAGYATGGFGKWGLGAPGSEGAPERQGFERFFGYNCQREAWSFYPDHLWDNERRVELEGNARGRSGAQYSHDVICEAAREFVRANRERPFFLYVPSTIPHLALQVPNDSLAEYVGLWEDPPYVGGKGYLPHPAPRAAYAAMVTRLDREVGRLVDLVDELGLTDDTLFLFTSDNGPTYDRIGGSDSDFFESSGPLRGRKGSVLEGGLRVPLVVRWRGHVTAGTESDLPSAFWDLLPTLAELAGARLPGGLDGISFAPTLLGRGEQALHDHLYWEFRDYGGQQAIRLGDWKGVRLGMAQGSRAIELYDLAADPGESTDLAAEHPAVVARIEELMATGGTPSELFPLAW